MRRVEVPRVPAGLAAALVAALVLSACSTTPDRAGDEAAAPADASASASHGTKHGAGDAQGDAAGAAPERVPLLPGERIADLVMPTAYTPRAAGDATDDYRCFLLDPGLVEDTFVTGVDVHPGDRDIVHHVILFRVPPGQVAAAEQVDRQAPGPGWTCFGGSGLEQTGASLDDAPWLGAWAPGSGERVLDRDIGIPLEAGSRIVMQVHYNLRAGDGPDRSRARLRLAGADSGRTPLETTLLPAPVELPCRAGVRGALCDREAAVLDVMQRFGDRSGRLVAGLQLICSQGTPRPGPTQTCSRPVQAATTVRAAAGHMHLLGRSLRIEANPGTPRARTILDIPVWDFDDQGARPLRRPVHLRAGDTLRVSCTHDQGLRDLLPAFAGQPERYVVWGEGTTDEMCLGILMVTRP